MILGRVSCAVVTLCTSPGFLCNFLVRTVVCSEEGEHEIEPQNWGFSGFQRESRIQRCRKALAMTISPENFEFPKLMITC
jgi:hypothetical protein